MAGRQKEHTLCWDCANACGKCSWSSVPQKPVSGWVAEPTVHDKIGDSFIVRQCPRFVRDAFGGGMLWSEKKNTVVRKRKRKRP